MTGPSIENQAASTTFQGPLGQAELDAMLADLHRQLLALGVPVSKKTQPGVRVNTRAKRRLGCCILRQGEYTIEVAARLLGDPGLLRLTLLHELLHTCPGCRDHGETWKRYAQYVNQQMGANIQRTVRLEEEYVPLRQEEFKYVLRCEACGKEIRRKRMCKVVKAPWRYRCLCGGKLKRVR